MMARRPTQATQPGLTATTPTPTSPTIPSRTTVPPTQPTLRIIGTMLERGLPHVRHAISCGACDFLKELATQRNLNQDETSELCLAVPGLLASRNAWRKALL